MSIGVSEHYHVNWAEILATRGSPSALVFGIWEKMAKCGLAK